MDKLLNMKLIKAVYGEQFDWKTRVFRFFLQQAVLVAVFYSIRYFSEGLILPAIGVFSSIISSGVLFYLTFRIKNLNNIYFVTLFITNVILFPAGYIIGKGYDSVLPLWFLVFIVVSYVFLDGWKLYFIVICTIIADTAAFLISLFVPTLFQQEVIISHYIMSLCINIPLLGIILGIIIKYQMDNLAKQRKIAEERGKEIEDISDSKSMFFANMSHEIRTPINTIIGLNEMILREDVSDEIAENAINIQNASKILLALINDILDMSKMESGKMEIVPAQYETASMFSDLVNIIWTRANQKGLEFKIDISEDIPSVLYGDEIRIKQILTNILTNAVKYTEKGSVTLTITGEQTGNDKIRLKYSVEDTGIGIKKDSLEDLFTVFKRFDANKTKSIEGSGLGLSIAKQLVDMMGGDIKVDSIYGKGSNFTITLEQGIVDHNPLGAMKYADKRGAKNREIYERSFEAPDAKILVVDDNGMNLMVVKKLLRDTKVQVETATSGAACLELTLHNSYHVILMDHLMPGMDGEQTLEALRTRQEGFCQKVPVIALTANVMTNALQWYQQRGFDGYMSKPISGHILESTLIKYLPEELIEYREGMNEGDDVLNYSSMTFHKKKKRIAICTECVCDLPDEWVKRRDIKLMWYYVQTEEGRFLDTKEIFSKDLLEYLKSGKLAMSYVGTVSDYETFMSDRLSEAEQVIYITMASGIPDSGFKEAVAAAKNFDNVTIIDSGQISSGLGLLVLRASQMAEDGVEVGEIIKVINEFKSRISMTFMIDSPEAMYKNGRISKNVADISNLLHIHPIIVMKKGKLTVHSFAIGKWERAAKAYIRSRLLVRGRNIDTRVLFVTYVGLNKVQLDFIRKEIDKYIKFDVVRFQEASATVSGNSGIGTFGLIYGKN